MIGVGRPRTEVYVFDKLLVTVPACKDSKNCSTSHRKGFYFECFPLILSFFFLLTVSESVISFEHSSLKVVVVAEVRLSMMQP